MKNEIEQQGVELENTTNKRIALLDKEGVELRENYETNTSKLIEQKSDILIQIQKLKDNMSSSEELFNQEIDSIKQNFEENKNILEKEHAEKIKEIVKQYEEIPSQEIEELKVNLEKEKEKYSLLNSELYSQRNQVEVEYEKEKTELLAKKNELTNELENKNALLRELTAEKDSEYKQQLERVDLKKAELNQLKDKISEEIYSRANFTHSHFLALEYKLTHPDTYWRAEFSDPLIYTMYKKERTPPINDQEFVNYINEKLGADYTHIKKEDSVNLICEYLTYVFADEVIFTNENQAEVMGELIPYPVDIDEKTTISPHPTLDEKYYYIKRHLQNIRFG